MLNRMKISIHRILDDSALKKDHRDQVLKIQFLFQKLDFQGTAIKFLFYLA